MQIVAFVVTSNDFVPFRIAVNSNCNGKVTVKNGYRIKSQEFLLTVMKVR